MKNYIYKKDRLKMTSLTIVFDAGSELEETGKKGTMHLMEHLICKTFLDMYTRLSENGIDWNAYTSEDAVIVWFEGLDSRLNSDMKTELVKRLLGGINITEEEFKSEQSVVLQEYMDCVFDNRTACTMNILRKYWNNFLPIGYENDIKNFSYQDMHDTYEKYFKIPARIVEVGPTKTECLADFCKDFVPRKHKSLKFGEYDNDMIETDLSVKTPVYMLFPKAIKPADYPYIKVGLLMLTNGLESPYYKELREKRGLSYYVSGCIEKNVEFGMMLITACTNTERVDELMLLMGSLTDDLYDMLSEERFNTIMEKIKVDREKEKILKYQYSEKYSNITKLKMPEKLDKITLEEVRYRMSRYFSGVRVVKGI